MIWSKSKALEVSLMLFLASTAVHAQSSISAEQAREHVGQKMTVCGNVASTHYASTSRGNPTFINLDKPYPNQVFTVLIWGSDRPRFGEPEQSYRNKGICVTGQISDYKGVPEIVASSPSQIVAH